MYVLTSLLAGLVFGLGLIVSGMANPAKVLGFLDLAGRWDPSLAFVMAGAIAVGAFAFTFARRRTVSLLGLEMKMPTNSALDRRLLGGSLHRSTDAMDEAGRRISKYLTMQLVVNLTYGIPMAAGLWFIGVPGALLWGVYQGTQAVLAGQISAGHLGQTVVLVAIFVGAVAVLSEVWGDLLRAAGATERLMEAIYGLEETLE